MSKAAQVTHLDELARSIPQGVSYFEFLREGMFSAGIYRLPTGGEDLQDTHAQDEIYFVVSGKATLIVGQDRLPVRPGSIAFVGKGADHRFVDIRDDLNVLVFFAPPEAQP